MAAVASLAGAEVIHAIAAGAHGFWLEAGLFFVVIAALEGLLAVGLFVVPSRSLYAMAMFVSGATVAVWLVSRTAGLPMGPAPGVPLAIGTADSVSTFLEVLTIAALAPLVLAPGPPIVATPKRRGRAAVAASVTVIASLTAVGAAAPEPVPTSGHHALRAPMPAHSALDKGTDG